MQTPDGQSVEIEGENAKWSGKIVSTLEQSPFQNVVDLCVPDVSINTLKLIENWGQFHNDKSNSQNQIKKLETDFLKNNEKSLNEIISAATFLDIGDLLDVSCKKVASMIGRKTSDQLVDTFTHIDGIKPAPCVPKPITEYIPKRQKVEHAPQKSKTPDLFKEVGSIFKNGPGKDAASSQSGNVKAKPATIKPTKQSVPSKPPAPVPQQVQQPIQRPAQQLVQQPASTSNDKPAKKDKPSIFSKKYWSGKDKK